MGLLRLNRKCFIMVNGNMERGMEEENNFGQMVHNMKDIGKMIRQTVKAD